MAIAYRGAASNALNGTVAAHILPVVVPSSVQVGDCILAIFTAGAALTSGPSGYSAVQSGSSSANVFSAVYSKVATSGDAGATANFTATAAKLNALIVAYSGTDTTTPIGASAVGTESISQTTHTSPSITTSTAGWIVDMLAMRDTSTAISTVWTPPIGSDRANVHLSATSQVLSVVADSNGDQAAGTFAGSWTIDAASQNAVMFAIGLTPNTAVPAGPVFKVRKAGAWVDGPVKTREGGVWV